MITHILLILAVYFISCKEPQRTDQTEKRNTNHKKNHLATETSPYLLQHADNPVNWYPWVEEALRKAKKEDKPIFLSIGYSACHWCQVMEHESFEDEGTARLMKELYVCIKVDREERPDLNQIYMNFVQQTTGWWGMASERVPDVRPGTFFWRYIFSAR